MNISKMDEIEINGVKYIRKDIVNTLAELSVDGFRYCIVRTRSTDVHIGYVSAQDGSIVKLLRARRLCSWKGAVTLSQVAMDGCQSDTCSMEVPEIILTEAIEIIPCSKKAKLCLESIPVWSK